MHIYLFIYCGSNVKIAPVQNMETGRKKPVVSLQAT